jgi:hypothetical protein
MHNAEFGEVNYVKKQRPAMDACVLADALRIIRYDRARQQNISELLSLRVGFKNPDE